MRPTSFVILWMSLVIASGCGGSERLSRQLDGGADVAEVDTSEASDVGRDDSSETGLTDEGRADQEASIEGAPPLRPPLDLPGIVLWLDGDVGVAITSGYAISWMDRSDAHHILTGEPVRSVISGCDDPFCPPLASTIARHGAVAFNGRNRFQLGPDSMRDALQLGTDDFVLAIVAKIESDAALGPLSPDSPGRYLFGLLPEILPNALSFDPTALAFDLRVRDSVTVGLSASFRPNALRQFVVTSGDPYDQPALHVFIFDSVGTEVQFRVDGQSVLDDPYGRVDDDAPDGGVAPVAWSSHETVFVGRWDFNEPGWPGEVGEVVLIKGSGANGAIMPVETYLRQKYGL
jgi:hypothetical protein